MRFARIVKKRIQTAGQTGESGKGANLDGDVDAVFSVNVGEGSSRTRVVSKQRIARRSVKRTRRDAGLENDADG